MDEAGEVFQTKYLADKTGLSGGWRGFSLYHELVDGDALVFHLVKPTEFKVTCHLNFHFIYFIHAYSLVIKEQFFYAIIVMLIFYYSPYDCQINLLENSRQQLYNVFVNGMSLL